MAKPVVKKEGHPNVVACLCQWETSIFVGVILFLMGLLRWAYEARLISPEMFWPDALMIMGILFALKGAFFSVFRQ